MCKLWTPIHWLFPLKVYICTYIYFLKNWLFSYTDISISNIFSVFWMCYLYFLRRESVNSNKLKLIFFVSLFVLVFAESSNRSLPAKSTSVKVPKRKIRVFILIKKNSFSKSLIFDSILFVLHVRIYSLIPPIYICIQSFDEYVKWTQVKIGLQK